MSEMFRFHFCSFVFLIHFWMIPIPDASSAWEILHSGVNGDFDETHCFPHDSCFLPRKEEEDHLWSDFTCECGMHCIQYSSCCADSPYAAALFHTKSRTHTTCQKLAGMTNAVLATSKCSDRWRNVHQIMNKCEHSELEMTDPLGMIPVTNLKTRVTYKNYFCALCNDDAEYAFFWNVSLQLGNKETVQDLLDIEDVYILENIHYDDSHKSWGIEMKNVFYGVNIQAQLPHFLQKIVKKCYLNTISTCNPLYSQFNDLYHKCSSYYAPIKLKVGQRIAKFRNTHCALCNGVNVTKVGVDICELGINRRRTKRPFSYTLLLDINRKDGDLVGLIERCGEGQTWDPFFKKCRDLTCALPGHVVVNQKCVPS